jgi:hypothetical protein
MTLGRGTRRAAGRGVRRRLRRRGPMRSRTRGWRTRRNARTGMGRGTRTMRGRRSAGRSGTSAPVWRPSSTLPCIANTSFAASASRAAVDTQRSVAWTTISGTSCAVADPPAAHAVSSPRFRAAHPSRTVAVASSSEASCRFRDTRIGRRWTDRSAAATVRSVDPISRSEASRARLARKNGRTHPRRSPCGQRRSRQVPEAPSGALVGLFLAALICHNIILLPRSAAVKDGERCAPQVTFQSPRAERGGGVAPLAPVKGRGMLGTRAWQGPTVSQSQ